MDKFDGKNYYVKSIRDYRKWCARLYIELWVDDDYYTTVYYNLRSKHEWGYGKNTPRGNVVDFEDVEEMVRKVIIQYIRSDSYLWYNLKERPDEYYQNKELHEFADISINYKGEKPKEVINNDSKYIFVKIKEDDHE